MSKRKWTEAEDRVMREFYPRLRAADLADVLKRSVRSVYMRADTLGLAKSEEFFASDRSGRVQNGKMNPAMVASQFKPGHGTWNKGMKGVVGVQEACRATQFKPGSKPHTTVPVGSYRTRRETSTGALVLERKTSETPGPNHKRWVPVSRLAWEAEHGPVPAGSFVVFKRGQQTHKLEEITADRLECITRAENAQRNHPRNRSPELARLVQLKGAITRQVNRIAREAEEQRA